MSKATYEGIKENTNKRPFVITRACYAGTQKYSTVWTGDNQSIWEHLRMAVPQLINLGLSGMAFCGTDVGGFSYDSTGELLSRWVQVGCFSPLFRNHSSTRTRDQEPWAFDKQTEDICRKYIKLRYKLLPYFYDILKNTEETGLPLMRPLFMHYQNDEKVYEINDEFLVGENILVAPVIEQGKTARIVYLPEGIWIDYWTGEVYEGKNYIIKEAPLDTCPIYIKEGSIIPNYVDQNYVGEKEMYSLILDVYPGFGEYNHYVDDGESFEYRNGCYSLYKFKMDKGERLTINVSKLNDGYDDYKTFNFKINNISTDEIKVNGESVEFKNVGNGVEFEVPSQNMTIEIL
jgi:alpha-glucosidase